MNNNVFKFQQIPELVHLVTVKRLKEMETNPPTLKRLLPCAREILVTGHCGNFSRRKMFNLPRIPRGSAQTRRTVNALTIVEPDVVPLIQLTLTERSYNS